MTDKKALMILNRSPAECDLQRQVRAVSAAAEAGAVLWMDAVYFAVTEDGKRLLDAGINVYALRQSMEARGLCGRAIEGVEVIDYDGMVDLIMEDYDIVV